jgi:hypothetical protein
VTLEKTSLKSYPLVGIQSLTVCEFYRMISIITELYDDTMVLSSTIMTEKHMTVKTVR